MMLIRLRTLRRLIKEALQERVMMYEDAVAGEQEPNELYADYRPADNFRPDDNYRPGDNYRPDASTYLGFSTPIGPEDNYRPTDASSYIGMTVVQQDDEFTGEDEEGLDDNPEDETVTTAATEVGDEDDVPEDETNDDEFRID
jgi:hypothetical protein